MSVLTKIGNSPISSLTDSDDRFHGLNVKCQSAKSLCKSTQNIENLLLSFMYGK